MTLEEAANILDRRTTIPGDGYTYEQINGAIDLALAALRTPTREQVEKVWRGEWIDTRKSGKDVPTCMCSRCTRVVVGLESKFCPDCGSPMTDEAVEIVMERLEALESDARGTI